ncbi:ParB/RepB/Spo0J family partition protein [Actinoplanes sp. CA-142083]|uniref:ParB/RepB/Spo0J family partition protein n=1 Tax=Actinoplanes sp. CA-142083 TaxID=3239903 RepID=UPI003D8DEF15
MGETPIRTGRAAAPAGLSSREATTTETSSALRLRVQEVDVARIRPEDGLGRKRDRDGHLDLQRSIEQFGVLTPITVRLAEDGSNDYLLIKGQGRTLACRLLGIPRIPAVVVDQAYAETQKVQQFLVENVARLKMRPVDRALLIARARQAGEETADVAKRFGVRPSTVRRLEAQLEGASNSEVAALKSGKVNLALHAVIARHVCIEDRAAVVSAVSEYTISARDLDELFVAIGWSRLVALGDEYRDKRTLIIAWACSVLNDLPAAPTKDRLRQLAARLPRSFTNRDGIRVGVAAE